MTVSRGRLPALIGLVIGLCGIPLSCAHTGGTPLPPRAVPQIGDGLYAVIIHNGAEEALILGTHPVFDGQGEVLDLEAFPSRPAVTPLAAAPFRDIARLMRDAKGIEVLSAEIIKDGGAGTVPIGLLEGAPVRAVMYRFQSDKIYVPLHEILRPVRGPWGSGPRCVPAGPSPVCMGQPGRIFSRGGKHHASSG